MHYILYRVTNKVNGKIYVGVHKTPSLDDGYMGSGKVLRQAIKKHGLENFEKEILEIFNSAADMYAREKEIVTEEFIARDDTYNLRRGGTGGFDYINSVLTSEQRAKNATETRDYSDQEFRDRVSESQKNSWKSGNRPKSIFPPSAHVNNKTKEAICKIIASQKKTYQRTLHQQGSKNSQFGSFWITDGASNKKHRGEIPEGWRRGRISA